MGETEEDVLEALAMVIIVVLGLIVLIVSIMPSSFTGTSAGAFAVATGISYSISGLSLADEGSMTRYLNGSYDIEIGLEEDSDGPLKNYYIRATAYGKGNPLSPIDKIIFIGDMQLDKDPTKLVNVTYISLTKSYGKPVRIVKTTETRFSDALCKEPTPEKIKDYIQTYSPDKEEQKWIKAIIMTESGYVHCSGSTVGAFGFMQLMEIAARDVGISDRFDPEQNIDGGVRYYRKLVQKYESYDDKYVLAVASYNCGKIGTLVSQNCDAQNIYIGCWEKAVREFTREKECQGSGGKETYNYVDRVKTCVKYYEQNPECYNSPGTGSSCPKSSDCGNW
ncbi:MAG: lytic transglycosylase domain-containing protein [Candidatus Aenigmarchaeota archaeon]|nr:lytic transglycosylase domain-containing protein [Candidatus Aenigmarchaeota archaeon]